MTHRLSNRCEEKRGFGKTKFVFLLLLFYNHEKRLRSIRKSCLFFSLIFRSNFQVRASCKTWTRRSLMQIYKEPTAKLFLVHEHRWRHDAQILLPLRWLRVVTHSFLLALCGFKTPAATNDSVSCKKKNDAVFFLSEGSSPDFYLVLLIV